MKKWLYFVAPVIGLTVFLFFYFSHKKEAEALAAQRKEQVEMQAAADAKRKAQLEEIARKDAAKKAAERVAEEAAKEAARKAKWDAEGAKINADTQEALTLGHQYAAKVASLRKELSDLRARREQDNHNFMEAARELEIAQIGRHAIDMEGQRIIGLIVAKADASTLAAPPPLPDKKKNN